VIVSDGKTAGDVLGEAAEVVAHALADRFECLEAGRTRCGMNADALGRTVIKGGEHRGLTLAGDGRGQVGASAAVSMNPRYFPKPI
jgi:hypothetical protein